MLGMDTQYRFFRAGAQPGRFHDLMAVPAARRAVALWQIGENGIRRARTQPRLCEQQ